MLCSSGNQPWWSGRAPAKLLHTLAAARKSCEGRQDMGGCGKRRSQSWGEGGAEEEDRRCMIKAYILKSLTSPLVWLMGPASQSDRGKGLEKWCNYCFLNRGLKRPAWKEDLEEILQGILDSSLPPLHPSNPLLPPRHTPWRPTALASPFPSKAPLIRLSHMLHWSSLSWGSVR